MLINDKFHRKRYVLLSLLNLLVFSGYEYYVSKSYVNTGVVVIIFLSIVLNHLLLAVMVGKLLYAEKSIEINIRSTLKNITLFLFKNLLLMLVFYIGVQFVGDRIIVSLILYVMQLITFGLSLNR